MDRKQVGILVFEDVEVLDFCGPFEVFSATRLDEGKRWEDPSPFNVFLVAEKKKPVVASGGLRVLPDYDLRDCPEINILVVPGGWGTRRKMNNARLLKWITDRSRHLEIMTSVCTGSLILGRAGLLDGRHATTHWRSSIGCRNCFRRPSSKKSFVWSKKGTSSLPPGFRRASTWRSKWSCAALARRSPGPPPNTWSIPFRKATPAVFLWPDMGRLLRQAGSPTAD